MAADESMILFNGRLALKQYIKSKPNPWGIKAHMHSHTLIHSEHCAICWSEHHRASDVKGGKGDQPLPTGLTVNVNGKTSVMNLYWHQRLLPSDVTWCHHSQGEEEGGLRE
ncbi:unnamed protein product, partial [Owenia fusiformis]